MDDKQRKAFESVFGVDLVRKMLEKGQSLTDELEKSGVRYKGVPTDPIEKLAWQVATGQGGMTEKEARRRISRIEKGDKRMTFTDNKALNKALNALLRQVEQDEITVKQAQDIARTLTGTEATEGFASGIKSALGVDSASGYVPEIPNWKLAQLQRKQKRLDGTQGRNDRWADALSNLK
jgi:hypothetical protein